MAAKTQRQCHREDVATVEDSCVPEEVRSLLERWRLCPMQISMAAGLLSAELHISKVDNTITNAET